jgi:hypothetical protein
VAIGEVVHLAREHGLAAVLHGRLEPSPLREALASDARRIAARSVLLADAQASLCLRFVAAGVRVVALKGPALEADLYGPAEPRDQEDIDLLVVPEDVGAAETVLRNRGFVPGLSLPEGRRAAHRRSHAAVPWVHASLPVSVDLHWRLVLPRFGVRLDEKALLERAVPSRLSGRPVRVLSPGDRLLVLAVHGGKDRWASLLRLSDLVRLLARHPGVADPAVFDRAARARCLRMLHVALLLGEQAAPGLVGEPALERCRLDDEAVHLAGRLLPAVLRGEVPAGPWSRLGAALPYREHASDRARMVLGTLFTPTPAEWSEGALPAWLEPLYRPVRLALRRESTS